MTWSLTPLGAACANRDPATVQLLLDLRADASLDTGDFYIPFNIAIEAGCFECARVLLDAGFDIDTRVNDCSVFFGPAIRGDLDAVDFLLDRGADARLAGGAVFVAIYNGNHEAARLLLDYGAPPTPQAFRSAVRRGDERSFAMLLECGGDLLERSSNGRTPLFAIAYDSHSENRQMWQRIVDAGVDVNARDASGRTALIDAAENARNPAAVLFLLEHGADPNLVAPNGTTALSQAAYRDHLCNVLVLLGFGADPAPAMQVGFVGIEDHIEEAIIEVWNGWYKDGSSVLESNHRSSETDE